MSPYNREQKPKLSGNSAMLAEANLERGIDTQNMTKLRRLNGVFLALTRLGERVKQVIQTPLALQRTYRLSKIFFGPLTEKSIRRPRSSVATMRELAIRPYQNVKVAS